MNRFSPADASQESEPQELYDPGASQVYIPKPSPTTRKQIMDDNVEIDLSQIEGQILLDFPAGSVSEQVTDYSKFNGKLDSNTNNGWSDC